jgi:hypothetical protein
MSKLLLSRAVELSEFRDVRRLKWDQHYCAQERTLCQHTEINGPYTSTGADIKDAMQVLLFWNKCVKKLPVKSQGE